jgi:predicted permease
VAGEANLSARDRPRRATSAAANAELLEALAVPPERGRWFRREETSAGGPAVVILAHELWQSAFGGREDLVGQSIDIDGVGHEVIGIMPPAFDLMDKRIQVWLPLQLAPTTRQFRASHFLSVVGRLKEGIARERAESELASLMETWGDRVGASGHVFAPGRHVLRMQPVLDEVVGSTRRAFWLLQAAVGLVLLIACANLASLLTVRADARRTEVAIRTALGAGRRRLLAQFLAEGLVLVVLGTALGLVVASIGIGMLKAAYPESVPRVADVGIDPTVLAFTLLAASVTGVVFGLVPLRYLSERVGGRLLNDRTAGTTRTRSWARRLLVSSEAALAMVLVVASALMMRTVSNLMNVKTGFERSGLVTFGVALPAATYPTFDQRVQLYARLIDRFGGMPEMEGVAAVTGLPPHRERNLFGTDIEDYPPPPDRAETVEYYQRVTSGYFETMRIPIVQGRGFEATDRVSAPVAVVNEAFVRAFWKGLDPVGRHVRPHFGDETPWLTVVGVAKDVKQAGVDKPTGTELYLLLDQLPRIFPGIPAGRLATLLGDRGTINFMLRTPLPAAALQASITNAVREADRSLPVVGLRNMEEVVRDSVRRPRMLMQLFAVFAGLALLLAAIGTYGVLSYVVAQRRREIGIRMALGARRALVLRAVMGQSLGLTGVGVMVGAAGALAATRLMQMLLFEVRPNDPETLAAAAALIAVVALTASLLPAVRATRVDPMVALRDE